MGGLAAKLFLLLSVCFLNGWIQPARAQSTVTSLSLNQVNGIAWDATRARFFVGSGSNVLVIDPDAGQIVETISVGAQLDRIALSDDGKYVYASLSGQGTIQRVRVQDHVLEASISVGVYTEGILPERCGP
jgi:DNA-binding beta-propeller fold protein YncE